MAKPAPPKAKFSTISSIANDIKKQDPKDLEIYSLKETLIKANAFINSQADEIDHLKKLLDAMTPTLNASKLMPSDEEVIADLQIAKLKQIAMDGLLTVDDCRALDILVKTKRAAREQSNATIDVKGLPKNLGTTELLKIASKKLKD